MQAVKRPCKDNKQPINILFQGNIAMLLLLYVQNIEVGRSASRYLIISIALCSKLWHFNQTDQRNQEKNIGKI